MKRKVLLASLFSLSTIATILVYSGFRLFSPKPATKQAQVEAVQSAFTIPEITPTTTPTPTITKPKLAKLTTVECVGPDGKHIQATKADCDNLNSYWSKNQPSNPSAPSNNSNTSTNPISLASNPTITPVATPTPTSTLPISVNTTSISVTLHKSESTPNNYLFGSGFTMSYQVGVKGYQLVRKSSGGDEGFYEFSGGLAGNAAGSQNFRSFVNPNKPLGTYNSNYDLQYYMDGVWHSGIPISLSITFVD